MKVLHPGHRQDTAGPGGPTRGLAAVYSRSPACRGPLGTPRGAGTDPDACHQCSQITQRAGQQDQQISQSTDRQRNGYSKLEAQSQLETQRPEKQKPGSSRDLEMQLPAPLPAHHTHRSRSSPVAAAPAEPQHPPPPLAGSECWWVTRAQPTGRPRGSCVPLSLPGGGLTLLPTPRSSSARPASHRASRPGARGASVHPVSHPALWQAERPGDP